MTLPFCVCKVIFRFEISRSRAAFAPGRPVNATAGMRAGAAKVKSLERRSILRPADQRSESEKLIERLFAVMNVSAAETVSLFEIERRDHLAGNDQIAQARRIRFQTDRSRCPQTLPDAWSNRLLQFVRRKLHVNRHHVFARRRERRIARATEW